MKPFNFNDHYMGAVELMRKAVTLAEKSQFPLYLAFSGGKDSQCIYHLAKSLGVDFVAIHNLTTIEPPELVYFIRENYPDVMNVRKPLSMWRLILKRKHMPTRWERLCCHYFKEINTPESLVITGVRAAESIRRANSRHEVEIITKRKEDRMAFTYEDLNEDGEDIVVSCVKGRDSILVNPIFRWTDADVLYYLQEVVKVPLCSLYQKGYKRVGCMFCPLTSYKERVRDAIRYPKYFDALRRAMHRLREIGKYMPEHPELSDDECLDIWMKAEGYEKWYAENIQQLSLF